MNRRFSPTSWLVGFIFLLTILSTASGEVISENRPWKSQKLVLVKGLPERSRRLVVGESAPLVSFTLIYTPILPWRAFLSGKLLAGIRSKSSFAPNP
jgi:hypothetical protein